MANKEEIELRTSRSMLLRVIGDKEEIELEKFNESLIFVVWGKDKQE